MNTTSGRHLFSFEGLLRARRGALAGLLALLALAACGSGPGSGLPCESTEECEPGETCVLRSCGAPEATCEVECVDDADCAGGLDSSPSGAVCVVADTAACPREGQPTVLNYCGQ